MGWRFFVKSISDGARIDETFFFRQHYQPNHTVAGTASSIRFSGSRFILTCINWRNAISGCPSAEVSL
jgi:hypothetical protein